MNGLKSILVLLAYTGSTQLPFVFAQDINNPISYCDRYLSGKDTKSCEKKVGALELDWYAAAICNKLRDDGLFSKCLQGIHRASFQMTAIRFCEGFADEKSQFDCIMKLRDRSLPATKLATCKGSSDGNESARLACGVKLSQPLAKGKKDNDSSLYQSLDIPSK